ncbi:MAG TPA: CvpA family protein [Verrucomicrobiae bacterium]|nr:CvpA family protein [Verrucomicrobiae bacterium]
MFANVIQSLTSDNLPLNWFDAVVVLVLGFGIFRGRKNGMSKEILPLFQWLAVVLVSGLFYAMVTQLIAKMVKLDPLLSNLLAYTALAAAVFLFFSLIKRTVGLKLFGSNLFGGAEYYFGMLAGMVRFVCILMFALAFLNARHYTAAQIEDSNKYQERWYGAHFFPDLYTVQSQVFEKSFTGPYIRKYLGVLLIEPTATGGAQPEPDAPVQ